MSASEWLDDFLTNSTELSMQKEFVEFCERMERKYNIPKRITQSILNKRSSCEYDQFIIFCMVKEIRNRMIKKLYTEEEIEKFTNMKYNRIELYNIILVANNEITEREKMKSCFQNFDGVIIEDNYIRFKIKANNENEVISTVNKIKQNIQYIDWIESFICMEENISESAIKNYINDMKVR